MSGVIVRATLCLLLGLLVRASPAHGDPDEGFVVRVARGDCLEVLKVHGELEAVDKVSIQAPEIDEYYVTIKDVLDNGTSVKKGDLILSLDDTKFRQELETARQEMQLAEAEKKSARFSLEDERIGLDLEFDRKRIALEKEKTMVVRDSTVISKIDLKKAELAVELAQLELNQVRKNRAEFDKKYELNMKVKQLKVEEAKRKIEQAEEKMRKSLVRAPRDGVIYKPFVTLNNEKGRVERNKVVRPGDLLLEIPSFTKFQGVCYVPASDFRFVGIGDKAHLRLTVLPERIFTGRVTQRDPYPMTRNERLGQNEPEGYLKEFKVTFAIEGNDRAFCPGLTFGAEIETVVARNCLFIPRVALYEESPGAEYVLVKTQESHEKRPVKVKARSLSYVEITEGLTASDRVVLAREQEGQRTAVVEAPGGQK